MPAYATQEGLVARFGEDAILIVADRDRDGVIDAAVVNRALADASAEIDAYVGRRYDLPISPVPELLVRLACDIALYRLSAEADSLTDEKRKRYDDARDLLEKVASREVVLGTAGKATAGTAQLVGPDRRFSRKSLKGLL